MPRHTSAIRPAAKRPQAAAIQRQAEKSRRRARMERTARKSTSSR